MKKLAIVHAIQLSVRAIKGGQHTIDIHSLTYKKIRQARKAGKGTR